MNRKRQRARSRHKSRGVRAQNQAGLLRRALEWFSEPLKPQIWLTLVWHMGLKLPCCWRTGPSTASERDHLIDMLEMVDFPDDTLFCGDAGFVGHDFWKTILDHGHSFLIRVGANVHLLKNLGSARESADLVYLWPDKVARKKKLPLVLRLLALQGPRGKVYQTTSHAACESSLPRRPSPLV